MFDNNNTHLVTGNSLLKKMVEALPEAIGCWRAFDEFDCHLHEDCLDEVEEWENRYEAWAEKLTGSPCIFNAREPCTCFDSILQQLRALISISHHISSCQIATGQRGGRQKRIQYERSLHPKHFHDWFGPRTITASDFSL